MDKKVKNFIELYNKCVSWNKEILDSMDVDYINKYEYTKNFIEHYLTTKTISEENYDLKNANVYDFDSDTLELQAYSYEKYGRTYFWVSPNETEQEYKNKRISYMTKALDNIINKKIDALSEISSVLEYAFKLKNMIK